MIRVFSVKCYWTNTRLLRKEYIQAKDEDDAVRAVEERGGYNIRSIDEDYNHLPNKFQLTKAKKYNIDVTNKTRKELRALINENVNK